MSKRSAPAGPDAPVTFQAMNTQVRVEGAPDGLEPWFRQVEESLSRFRPESPLSQLNRMPERWVVVPPLLHRVIKRALAAAQATGGAFDPTILPALMAAGYSRSFERGQTQACQPMPAGRWREVQVAPDVPAVWLPAGVQIDLGGIGKGLAVDGAMHRLRHAPHALVDAGGDIALRTAPGAPPVTVEVADPCDERRTLATFALTQGAVATSSTLGRRWGQGLHHIIDPRTGAPAASGLAAATVFAPRAALADVLAKACIVLGAADGLALLRAQGCHGLLVSTSGQTITTPGLEEFGHVRA